MAHIHFQEGTFVLIWSAFWNLAALAVLVVCLLWLRRVRKADSRLITLAGLLTAAGFVAFMVPILPEVHLSLTPLVGIVTGPAIGGVIYLIVNIFSAAVGHQGWLMIGPNLLINMVEVVVAFFAYRWLCGSMRPLYSAGIATFVALFAGNLAMMAILLVTEIQGRGHTSLSELSFLAAVNIAVAFLEAFVTGYIVAYIEKVRPDMLGIYRS